MTVFEHEGRLLIVDCGVLFPEDHHPGVDLILPDFEAIRDRLPPARALGLRPGQGDHMGAPPSCPASARTSRSWVPSSPWRCSTPSCASTDSRRPCTTWS